MHVLDLCAGIGGLSLGVKLVCPAARTVCYVEREAFCASVLAARMESRQLDRAPIWSDVQSFEGKRWRGVVDCITAGYPCTPFSAAGKRRGHTDPRHVWPAIARVIGDVCPSLVFLENVPGHVSLGLRDVCADLHQMGFTVSAGIFSAAEVGALHLRQRLYILAHADRDGWEQGRPESEILGGGLRTRIGGASVAHANREGQSQQSGPFETFRRRPFDSGFPYVDWGIEPNVGRVAHGVPSRVDKLRALGNAVVPQTAALAFATLAEALNVHNSR